MFENTLLKLLIHFFDSFYKLYDTCCPVRIKYISGKRLLKPWISDTLIEKINTKHNLFKLYKNGRIDFDYYNRYKNDLSLSLKRAKVSYYRNKFMSCKNDLKRTWKSLNSLMRGQTKKNDIVLTDEDGNEHSDPQWVADKFCNYFTTVASKLDDDIPASVIRPLDYVTTVINQSFFINPCSPIEVKNLIMSLQNKHCNIKNIPIFIYKLFSSELSFIISYLFNLSVSEGTFPHYLKLSRTIPLYKAKIRTLTTNYRPISLTHPLSKIFEKLMCRRLREFLDRHNILSPNQFGFRGGLSTVDAVLQLVDECVTAFDQKRYLVAVFLDLSKAFDTVNHDILLSKLEAMGLRGLALAWFRSFLTDRRVVVDVGGHLSNERVINIGLPQGTVLSPILFLLYINDMCNASNALNYLHFADDTTIHASADNIDDLCNLMSRELQFIDKWLITNRLSLNIDKSSYMIFSHNAIDTNLTIKIRQTEIKRVSNTIFLGVTLDDKLKFDVHTNNVINKLSRSAGVIFRLAQFIPSDILKMLYFSIYYPHLIYCIQIWGSSNISNVNSLKRVHKRVFKTISRDSNSDDVSTWLLSIESIFSYFILVKFFKFIRCNHYSYFTDKINALIPVHNHNTRFNSALSFNIPEYNKSLSQKFFLYQSISRWNSLPDHVKYSTSIDIFKHRLKHHLVTCST